MPKRINPIAQYLLCLAISIFAYAIYARFAVPVIEGSPKLIKRRVSTQTAQPANNVERNSKWAHLFPDDAWEMKSSNTLKTATGRIIFQDYQVQPDGLLIVFPFTMIMEGKTSSPETGKTAPIVLRCMQEAKIKFDRPFTMGAKSGEGSRRMERAQLTGEVTIYRPPSSPNANDSLEIVTRNVQIEKKSVYTLEEVDFQFGSTKGKGRNLVVQLSHETPANNAFTNDFSQIDGIRRLELAFLHHLRIEPSQSTNQAQLAARDATSKPTSLFSGRRTPIDITCKGPFVFDFTTKTAVIRKQVHVRQDDQFGDDLHCEILTLVFEGEDADALNPLQDSNSSMKLKRITATGSPAIINAYSNTSRIEGPELNYDLMTNRVVAKSQGGSVTVVNKEYQFDARSFIYTIPPDQSLGPLHAQGPGRMLRTATPENDEFRARWKDKLIVRDEEDGRKLVQMDGATRIGINQDTQIDADHLKFWLWRIPVVEIDPITGQRQTKVDYQPARLHTTGNVKIDSPRLAGTTRVLVATWPKPITGISNIHNQNTAQPVARRLNRRPVYQDAALQAQTEMIAPANRNAQFELAAFNQPVPHQRKFRFEGDEVDVLLSSHASGSEVRQLDIDGNVSIEETRTAKPQDHPLKISGSRLQMVPQGSELYRIKVAGSTRKKAIVDAEGLLLTGVTIHLDQSANKLWVEGAGNMHMQPPNKKGISQFPNANKPAQIDVSWGGGMVFDGRTIYFEQDVIMNAVQQPDPTTTRKTKSLSQGLSVQLKKFVNFKNLSQDDESGPNGGAVEVEEMILVDQLRNSQRVFQLVKSLAPSTPAQPIIVENQDIDPNGNLIEKQKFIVLKATINAITGDIDAVGPGTIINHRKGRSSFSFSPNSRQTQPIQKSGISFLQINFDGSLKANSTKQEMLIAGNVRTLYSPVNNWNQVLDPDQIQQIPMGAVKLTCDTIEMGKWHPRSNGGKPTKEIIAQGNAHIYGDLFEATSDRVSYDQVTDIIKIEGTPRSDANLKYWQNRRAQPNHLVAGKIRYRISDQATWVQKIKNGSFTPTNNR